MRRLTSTGIISVAPHKGRIAVEISDDFIQLYRWLITNHYWINIQTPLHKSHITICSPKHHIGINWDKAIYYDKQELTFEYDPYIIEGGCRKGFLMYYMKVFSEDIVKMKKRLGIDDGPNYRGLHITIGSAGKGGSPIIPYWPKTITISSKSQ